MAIASLFGPTPQQLLMARQKEAQEQQMLRNQQIAQQGGQFGVFAPLYQAGLRFGDVASQAAMQGLFPQQMDPALQQASAVQSVLGKYQGEDLSSPETLTKIGRDLMQVAPDAGLKALTLAGSLTKEKKTVTLSPGQQVIDPATKEVIYTAPEKPTKEDKITPLDAARQSVLTLGARDPNTLSQTERNELNAATTLLRLNAPGTTVNVGDKSVSVAAGKAIGEAQAAIDNKFSALTSLKNAKKLLEAGIYAGPYAPLEQGLAKYSGGIIGSRQKVVNTERFLSEIGNTVIPRLQEFGGNDSVEELKYLRDVQGGRIDLQPETLKGIIESAETKIQAGIERLKAQSDAIEKGERLPLGPMPSEQQSRSKSKTGKTVKRSTASGIEYEIVEE